MTAKDQIDFDPRLADWLEADPNTAPEPTLQIVLAAFPSIRQRRAMRVPWRFPTMSTIPKLAIGAAVVTAIALGGFMILRPPSTQPAVGVPGPSASPSPTSVPSGATSIDTTGWFRYTSEKYGFSAGIPKSYSVTPAVTFWVVPESGATSWTEWDTFHSPAGGIDYEGSSMRLPAGTTYQQWLAPYIQHLADPAASPDDPCNTPNEPVQPITIDGHDASMRVGCGSLEVLLNVGDRVYTFGGWREDLGAFDGQPMTATDDLRMALEAWFTTIKLDPASALEPPPATPIDLTTWAPFTSPWYGYSAAIPPAFKAHPASMFWVVPESATTSPAEWDDFHPDTGTATLGGSSIDLPAGMTFDAWGAAYRQGQVNMDTPPFCNETTQPLDPIEIDGHPGVVRTGCGVIEALVLVDDKVYSFGGSPGFSIQLGVPEDFRAMVEAWFTTIKLDPSSAVEPPAATQGPVAS